LPAITSYFIIDGNGHTIGGNNKFRIFKLDGGKLTISNLHMRDGSAQQGSAISVVAGGRLHISDSTFENCSADSGTIFIRYGTLHINRSNFLSTTADRGGAIYNAAAGEIIVSNSRLEYNTARRGGAIYHYVGKGVIANSTLRYNQASEYGGAIHSTSAGLQISRSVLSQNGGGVFAKHGRLVVSESDFNSNVSQMGPGIYLQESGAMVIDTDFAANSGVVSDEQIYGVESDIRYY